MNRGSYPQFGYTKNGVQHDIDPRVAELRQEMQYNIDNYGVPFLSGVIGGISRYGVGQAVQDLYMEMAAKNPLEIQVYPEDPEAIHYEIQWKVLTYQDGKLFHALEYEEDLSLEEQ